MEGNRNSPYDMTIGPPKTPTPTGLPMTPSPKPASNLSRPSSAYVPDPFEVGVNSGYGSKQRVPTPTPITDPGIQRRKQYRKCRKRIIFESSDCGSD